MYINWKRPHLLTVIQVEPKPIAKVKSDLEASVESRYRLENQNFRPAELEGVALNDLQRKIKALRLIRSFRHRQQSSSSSEEQCCEDLATGPTPPTKQTAIVPRT